MSFTFVFVCQAGRLEVDALLLAASLRRFARGDVELVAAVPTPASRWGSVRRDVLEALDGLGVRVVAIENRIDPGYPIGNKVSCLTVPTDAAKLVFLDSDVVCLREFPVAEAFPGQFHAKPADYATFGRRPGAWREVYATMGLPPPTTRMRSTVGGQLMPPYYNAGCVAAAADAGLGEAWLRACLAIDANPRVKRKRPWLDQIALPVAVEMLGLEVGLLTERHNFPAHARPVDDADPPVLCHYHDPARAMESAHAAGVVRELVEEHPLLGRLFDDEPAWARATGPPPAPDRLAVARRVKAHVAAAVDRGHARLLTETERRRDTIVTGLPRSGTSLYCSLLNSVPNAVCLNEVAPAATTFRTLRRMRRRIEAGTPVPNKVTTPGVPATDTVAPATRVEQRVASVADADFVLAHKLTLPYLNRLERLLAEGLTVWVVVRHPLHTIASWRRVPPHFGIARIDPPGPELAHIPVPEGGLDARRVAIWNHYARAIDRLRDRLEVVRYEDLVADPQGELARFCEHFGIAPPDRVPELASRNRPAAIPGELADLVSRTCELERFGYS